MNTENLQEFLAQDSSRLKKKKKITTYLDDYTHVQTHTFSKQLKVLYLSHNLP